MIKYFASFFLVSLTSGKSVRGILNSMLKYSNTFSSPLSNSFFFPVDNMVLVSVDKFAHHPSQRSASVSSDRRQGLHGPDHRKGIFFSKIVLLDKKLDTYNKLHLQTFADRALLIRSFIFLIVENLGNPWRSLKRSPLKKTVILFEKDII